MDYFWYTYVFIIGSIIGSFLNVCIYRIPDKESIVIGRSHCTSCGHELSFKEMIPIFSYLFLGGKCRCCKAHVSLQYPAVELLTAILYLLSVIRFGYSFYTLLLCIFISVLIVIAGIDAHTKLIPDILNLWILTLGILHILSDSSFFGEGILGFVIVSVPMLAISVFTGGFGGGDIKLSAVCGLFLGWKLILLGFFFGCITAALWGTFLILKKKASKKSAISFGPFLATGFILSALFGNQLLSFYLGLF